MDAGLAIEYLFGRTDAASIAQYSGRNRIKEKPSKTFAFSLMRFLYILRRSVAACCVRFQNRLVNRESFGNLSEPPASLVCIGHGERPCCNVTGQRPSMRALIPSGGGLTHCISRPGLGAWRQLSQERSIRRIRPRQNSHFLILIAGSRRSVCSPGDWKSGRTTYAAHDIWNARNCSGCSCSTRI